MKNIIKILIIGACFTNTLSAQNINWNAISPTTKNHAHISLGYDFGLTTQLGYAYKMNSKVPIWLTTDASIPMGSDLLDDVKIKIGAQSPLLKHNNFIATLHVQSIYRRYQSGLVSVTGFGADISGKVGLYKPRYHVALGLGFDKSIITHLDHSDVAIQNYQDSKSGWYLPAGGNWHYGISIGKTLGTSYVLAFDFGKINAQGNDQDALIPIYAKFQFSKMF